MSFFINLVFVFVCVCVFVPGDQTPDHTCKAGTYYYFVLECQALLLTYNISH